MEEQITEQESPAHIDTIEEVRAGMNLYANTKEFLFVGGPLHGRLRTINRNLEEVNTNSIGGFVNQGELQTGRVTYIKRKHIFKNAFTGNKLIEFFSENKLSYPDYTTYLEKLFSHLTNKL